MSDSANSEQGTESTQQTTQPAQQPPQQQPQQTPPANANANQQHSSHTFDPRELLNAINSIPEKIVQGLREANPAPAQPKQPETNTAESKTEEPAKTPGKKTEQPGDNRHWFAKWYQG